MLDTALLSVGAPGNIHDSTYFQSTDLWNRIEAGLVIPDQVQVVIKQLWIWNSTNNTERWGHFC